MYGWAATGVCAGKTMATHSRSKSFVRHFVIALRAVPPRMHAFKSPPVVSCAAVACRATVVLAGSARPDRAGRPGGEPRGGEGRPLLHDILRVAPLPLGRRLDRSAPYPLVDPLPEELARYGIGHLRLALRPADEGVGTGGEVLERAEQPRLGNGHGDGAEDRRGGLGIHDGDLQPHYPRPRLGHQLVFLAELVIELLVEEVAEHLL